MITFAIPFYSGIRWLPRTIESLLAQRDPGWRAIVCDDGSPEAGAEDLVRAVGDPRLTYQRNPRNLGMADNWNRCLELAETELVTLLHDDDELLPDYTGVVSAAAARHPDATALYTHAEIIGEDSRPRFSFPDFVKARLVDPSPRAEVVLAGERGLRASLRGNFITCPTLSYRKSRLGALRFSAAYRFVLDLELTTQILLAGGTIVGCPEVCYRYRRHQGNATLGFTRSLYRFEEEAAWFDRVHAVAVERGWRSLTAPARRKAIVKLNLGWVALSSLLRLRGEASARALAMLVRLQRKGVAGS